MSGRDGTASAPSNGSLMYGSDEVIICLNSTWNGSVFLDCLPNRTEGDGLKIYSDYEIIWTPDVIQRVASLCVIMAMTIVGNTLILIVLSCSKYRKINSRVNIFIINLAIGDLAVCVVTMTTEILFVAFGEEWLLGAAGCKLTTYAQIVTLASTTFILAAMSFDRYLAICKPLCLGTGNSRGKKMIIVSWTLAFIFAIPQLLIFVQVQDGVWKDGRPHYSCKSRGYTAFWQRKIYFTFLATYILIIPAILITFFYVNIVRVVWRSGRELSTSKGSGTTIRKCVGDKRSIPRARVRTIKMTLSIIITFIACWSPYFVTHLIRIYSEYKYNVPKTVLAFVETIALLQSALNPILYGCFNIKLKRGLLEVFCPGKVRQQHQNGFNANYSCRSIGLTDYASISEAHYPNDMYCSKRLSDKCKNGSASSEKNHKPEPRLRTKIIAETNKNGFRLRVRFLGRLSDRRASSGDRREGHGKAAVIPVKRMTLPTIVVQKPDSRSSSRVHERESEPQSATSGKSAVRPSTSSV
ncbi:neuropeptide S receptor-like [Lineus longissimus]|uniref:neuropeptide S receptor-like n=1 Tax=Lineus longissimus TaxID=88925 RepID=UPI002B4F7524